MKAEQEIDKPKDPKDPNSSYYGDEGSLTISVYSEAAAIICDGHKDDLKNGDPSMQGRSNPRPIVDEKGCLQGINYARALGNEKGRSPTVTDNKPTNIEYWGVNYRLTSERSYRALAQKLEDADFKNSNQD